MVRLLMVFALVSWGASSFLVWPRSSSTSDGSSSTENCSPRCGKDFLPVDCLRTVEGLRWFRGICGDMGCNAGEAIGSRRVAEEVKELAPLERGFRRRTVFKSDGSIAPKVDQHLQGRHVRGLSYHIV